MIVGQGPIVPAVGAVGGLFGHFYLIYLFSFLSPSLWETAQNILKYCLKGPLTLNNQPTRSSVRPYMLIFGVKVLREIFCLLIVLTAYT